MIPKLNPNYKKPVAPVSGWTASKDALLRETAEGLLIESVGTDPYIMALEIPTGMGRTRSKSP